jgi:hypothetical protein
MTRQALLSFLDPQQSSRLYLPLADAREFVSRNPREPDRPAADTGT